jgi:hypothetical protein
MKIEKYKCDGCGKEYATAGELTLRIYGSTVQKDNIIKLKTDGTEIAIKGDKSLDFCDSNCFELYLTNKKLEGLGEPK